MAVAAVTEWDIQGQDRSTMNYDAIGRRLDTANNPPAGGLFHTAGYDEEAGVFRIFDVWESREDAQRFIEDRLMPALRAELGDELEASAPKRQYFYELHDAAGGR